MPRKTFTTTLPQQRRAGASCPRKVFISVVTDEWGVFANAFTKRPPPLKDPTTPEHFRPGYLGTVGALISEDKDALTVVEANVEPRGCGIGTRLYEVIAAEACRQKVSFASDNLLSKFSGGFWKKQVAKGRATKHHGRYWISPCAATSLEGVAPKRRCPR